MGKRLFGLVDSFVEVFDCHDLGSHWEIVIGSFFLVLFLIDELDDEALLVNVDVTRLLNQKCMWVYFVYQLLVGFLIWMEYSAMLSLSVLDYLVDGQLSVSWDVWIVFWD